MPELLRLIEDSELLQDSSILSRKLAVKVAQRLALVLLKPKIAAWRYQRGQRSLTANLSAVSAVSAAQGQGEEEEKEEVQEQGQGQGDEEQEDDSLEAVPSDVEDIVDLLLRGLQDKDTIVRYDFSPSPSLPQCVLSTMGSPRMCSWSAAKGVGRITGRLPSHLADDIVCPDCVVYVRFLR